MKRRPEGFWTTLTLVCSAFVGVLAFVYSFIQSALASPLIGASLTAELHAYSFRSWASLIVSLVSFFVFFVVFGVAAVRRRHSRRQHDKA